MRIFKLIQKELDIILNLISKEHHKCKDGFFSISYDGYNDVWNFTYYPYVSDRYIDLKDSNLELLLKRAFTEMLLIRLDIEGKYNEKS